MGCAASKNTVSIVPAALECSGGTFLAPSRRSCPSKKDEETSKCQESRRSAFSRPSRVCKHVVGEQVAAGWPEWLSAAAGEAIQGWVPLKADSFEKLEKIGQGTYSSVFRARDLTTGRIVALKKVRLDNMEPECIRFMAREIRILRKLDHPNIIKLDGLITSQFFCSIYLVFEYMDHDLAGLLSCTDISFSEPQVKCYMHQLLSGLDHCHSHGIMHRDIKSSNLLVNNEGILKIADFGLANLFSIRRKKPLTSHVVTLWYRPPELLLGSTYYGPSVDLWSAGCVLAELLLGKPILQGRTEVEQLHKIFKLCGSPPEDYWRKSKLSHTILYKAQHPYKGSLRETCKHLPTSAINLIEEFLSIEPHKRGTAASALKCEYFATEPYACEPSSLPKYPPKKEMITKSQAGKRLQASGSSLVPVSLRWLNARSHGSGTINRLSRAGRESGEANGLCKLAAHAEGSQIIQHGVRNRKLEWELTNSECRSRPHVELHLTKNTRRRDTMLMSLDEIPLPGPLQVSTSSGFMWAKKRADLASSELGSRLDSRSEIGSEFSIEDQEYGGRDDIEVLSQGSAPCGDMYATRGQWSRLQHLDTFRSCKELHSEDSLNSNLCKNRTPSSTSTLGCQDSGEKANFPSSSLSSQSIRVDQMLEKHEKNIRRAIQRHSRLQRVLVHAK